MGAAEAAAVGRAGSNSQDDNATESSGDSVHRPVPRIPVMRNDWRDAGPRAFAVAVGLGMRPLDAGDNGHRHEQPHDHWLGHFATPRRNDFQALKAPVPNRRTISLTIQSRSL